MKTLQLMTKMQQEHEEKQKRRKLRRQQQQQQQQLAANTNSMSQSQQSVSATTTPRSERKFLSSIMNTLFSSGGKDTTPVTSPSHESSTAENGNLAPGGMSKSDAKRLSLKRLKAKDKAKKRGNNQCLLSLSDKWRNIKK